MSAGLLLAGSYVGVYAGRPVSIATAFTPQWVYLVVLLATLGYLVRVRRQVDHAPALLIIVCVLLVDGAFAQHRFGWFDDQGRAAASAGFAAGLAAVVLIGAVLCVPICADLLGTVLATTAFVRFAPLVLRGASEPAWGVVPPLVAYGWLLAACLLPALVLPPTRSTLGRLELARIRIGVVAVTIAVACAHFFVVGLGLDLTFHPVYLSPLVILLGPVCERLDPPTRPSSRLMVRSLPYLGLALAATVLTPGLTDSDWARTWPLTPFTLALALAILVLALRAHHQRSSRGFYPPVALTGLLLLGGDLPEILARLRFPLDWQVHCVVVLCAVAIWRLGSFGAAVALQLLPATLVASWLAELGYPWPAGFLAVASGFTLAIARLRRVAIGRRSRLLLIANVTLGPVLVMLVQHTATARWSLAFLLCAAAVVAARWLDDRVLRRMAILASTIAIVGYPLVDADYGSVELSDVLSVLGFVVLAMAVAGSLFGDAISRQLRASGGREGRTM